MMKRGPYTPLGYRSDGRRDGGGETCGPDGITGWLKGTGDGGNTDDWSGGNGHGDGDNEGSGTGYGDGDGDGGGNRQGLGSGITTSAMFNPCPDNFRAVLAHTILLSTNESTS